MYLPISVTLYPDRCRTEDCGTARFSSGVSVATINSRHRKILPPASACNAVSKRLSLRTLAFRRAALLWEQAPRPALDEENQEHQHEDLRQHRTGVGLEHLVDDPQRVTAQFGAP